MLDCSSRRPRNKLLTISSRIQGKRAAISYPGQIDLYSGVPGYLQFIGYLIPGWRVVIFRQTEQCQELH